jgi:hypothetical protein
MKDVQEMRRLAKCRSLVGGRHSLWLAGDHLLHVTNSGYSERVRRFYLGDIESMSLGKTRGGTAVLVVSVVVFAAFFAVYLYAPEPVSDIIAVFAWVGMAVVGFAALRSLILGPTSVCVLHTAVQEEELKALGRHRRALAVLHELAPHIVAAQGGPLQPGELEAAGETAVLEPGRHRADMGIAAGQDMPREPLRSVRWHVAAFGFLVLLGASYIADAFFSHPWKNAADTGLIALIVGLTVVALSRQSRGLTVPWLKQALIAVVVYLGGLMIFVSQFLTMLSFFDPAPAAREVRYASPVFQVVVVVSGLIAALLGVVGLMLVQDQIAWVRRRDAEKRGEEPPSVAKAGPAGADDDHAAE